VTRAKELFDRYRDTWSRTHGGAPTTKLGMTRHVVVGATDAEAEALARPNYVAWYANLTHLWRSFNSIPVNFARDLDEARQRGLAVVGSASRVREEIERQVAESTSNYFVARMTFGNMTEPEATANLERFVADVMPHLTKLEAR